MNWFHGKEDAKNVLHKCNNYYWNEEIIWHGRGVATSAQKRNWHQWSHYCCHFYHMVSHFLVNLSQESFNCIYLC